MEEVTRLSDGKVKIQIYPNSTIGGDRELLESCQDGDIPFVIQNTAPQVTFMPDIAVFDIPCRFDTIEEVREKVDDEKFYSLIEKVYEKEIESNINKGLLTRQADMLKLSEYGIDICNTVMSDFILTDGD